MTQPDIYATNGDLHRWVVQLVSAVEEHEDAHPKGYKHPGSSDEISVCLFGALNQVPDSIRAWVSGWKAGYFAAQQERCEQNVKEPKP